MAEQDRCPDLIEVSGVVYLRSMTGLPSQNMALHMVERWSEMGVPAVAQRFDDGWAVFSRPLKEVSKKQIQ